MKVLVCGGRDFNDLPTLEAYLDALHAERRIAEVIQGGARGADYLAHCWASLNGVKSVTYLADWEGEGRAAGPKRNQRMLDEGEPDLVVAFPGGRGTADMVRRARAAGVEVREVKTRGVA